MIITNIADPDCNATWEESWSKFIEQNVETRVHIMKHNPDKQFWVHFVKTISKTETCYNPTERFRDSGKDTVTTFPLYREGLLGMSYQDSYYYGCNFSWSRDKYLKETDYSKTIYDYKNNIECALLVLDKQLKVKNELYSNYYWSFLDKKNLRHAVFQNYLGK